MMKKLLFVFVLLILATPAWAATYYPAAAGGNWTTINTWYTDPGRTTHPAATPTSSVDVLFDSTATGTVTVNGTTCVAKTLVFNNANNKIAFTASQILKVSGNITLKSGMSYTGTGILGPTAAGTIASDGVTISGQLYFYTAATYVLNGNAVVTGLVTVGAATVLNWTTNESITCNGGLTTTAAMSGTATVIVGGGAISINSAGIANDMTINPNVSNVSLSANLPYKTGTLTYTAGSKSFTSSPRTLSLAGSCTLNVSGHSWFAIQVASSGTYTLTSDLTTAGTLSFLSVSPVTFSGASNIQCATLNITASAIVVINVVSGQNLTVTTSMTIYPATVTIQSTSAGSHFHLIYQGTTANCKVALATITDMDASGSSIPIDLWYGTVGSGCTNVYAVTSANIARDYWGISGN
jgi:hypothetical protein